MSSRKKIFKKSVLRFPRLDTILMIEKEVMKGSGGFTVREIWLKLPKGVMWQTFLAALDYLEYSNKIFIEDNKRVNWVFDESKLDHLKKHHVVIKWAGFDYN